MATTANIEVFVFAKSLEVEGLFVDEKTLPVNADGADAYGENVTVD